MDLEALMIQIARILNESGVYKCGFTAIGEEIYAFGDCYVKPFKIDPVLYLTDVKGR